MHKSMRQLTSLEGYHPAFKAFLFVVSGSMAQQLVVTTLTKEIADALPYVSSIKQIGDAAAAGRIVMAIATIIWAMLSQSQSRKRLLIIGGLLNVLPFAFTTVAPSYPLFAGALVLSFVGRGAVLALTPAITMDMAPPESRGKALSLTALALLGGSAIGTVVPSMIIDFTPWWVSALIATVWCLVALIVTMSIDLPEPRDGGDEVPRWTLASIREVLAVPTVLSLIVYYAITMLTMGGAGYYVFAMFKDEYLFSARGAMGVIMGAQSAIMMGTGFWGMRSDRALARAANGRVRVLIGATLITSLSLATAYALLPLYWHNHWWLAGYIAFSALSSFASIQALTPIMDSIVGDVLQGASRSLAISVRTLVGTLTTGLGMLAIGAIQQAQGTFAWAMAIGCALAPISVLALIPALRSLSGRAQGDAHV